MVEKFSDPMLKKIKSLFFVEDKEVSKESVQIEQKKNKITTKTSDVSTKDLGKFQSILLKTIEENDQEGYDYLEFRHSLQSLKKVTDNEDQRFLSALSMLSSVNSSPEILLKSGNIYLDVLEHEKKIFEDALVRQKAKMIDVKTQELKHTKKLIQDKEAQIKMLAKEIESHEQSLSELKSSISNADNVIQQNRSSFDIAYNQILSEIQHDLNRIKNLKGKL